MNFIIFDDGELTYHKPLGEKIGDIERLLRAGSCFCPSFLNADPYSVETYILEAFQTKTEFRLLLDRNIYSRVIELAQGWLVDDNRRLSAAVMAFASCANINVAPGLAIHEGAASGAIGMWQDQLALFHAADQIHPINWAALALGQTTHFSKRLRPKRTNSESVADFHPIGQVKAFEFIYPFLLKTAMLYRRGGHPDDSMRELLDFTYRYWLASVPGFYFASLILGRNPPKRAFKHIGSLDRNKALKGVKNAAWDLVYAIEWYKAVQGQADTNQITIFCTQDSLLQRLCRKLVVSLFDSKAVNFLAEAGFGYSVQQDCEAWATGSRDGERTSRLDVDDSSAYQQELVASLEKEFTISDGNSRA